MDHKLTYITIEHRINGLAPVACKLKLNTFKDEDATFDQVGDTTFEQVGEHRINGPASFIFKLKY